jgi:phosphoribosylformylglycinamidine synthase
MKGEDIAFCRDYFRDTEHRDPTLTEVRVIDTYWSDHCRHTTFNTWLDDIEIEPGPLGVYIREALDQYEAAREAVFPGASEAHPMTLMDMASIGARVLKQRGLLEDLDESQEVNACGFEIPVEVSGQTEPWLIQFKNETHNHPTEIEPFGGAATCLGGAIRDPLSGRAYVYQAMRLSGCGDPRTPHEHTLPGKLSQRAITVGAAQGFSAYGNQIGLATGQVTEVYDPGYVAKRMEVGAVIGACPKDHLIRGTPAPGDIILLAGGQTGRDGCGGATGSSKAHDSSSIDLCGAEVQKGNPPTERKLQRLFRNPRVSRMIRRCNDFGAGGVSVAIGELAPGLVIDLDRIPKKYEGLDGTELAISESQERMAVVVAPGDAEAFIREAYMENLEATPVAYVSENPRLIMRWRGRAIVNIARAFLDTNGVTRHARARIAAVDPEADYRLRLPEECAGRPLREAWLNNLGRLCVCSQKGLVERFDSTVGGHTVHMPLSGAWQMTPEEAMIAKIPVFHGTTDTATAMSFGFIPGLARWSPFHGGAFAVTEALSKLAAAGANPLKARLSMQEYYESLEGDPLKWGKPAAALLGAVLAQLKLNVPAIGGKDSMSGAFENLSVPPTLVCFAVAAAQASRSVSAAFKQADSPVAFLPLPVDPASRLPVWDRVKALYERIYALSQAGRVSAASVIREGGVAAAVTRMCLGNRRGFVFRHIPDSQTLFAPLSSSLIVELQGDPQDLLNGVHYTLLGHTQARPLIELNDCVISLDEAAQAWTRPLETVFPSRSDFKPSMDPAMPLYTNRGAYKPAVRVARPRVFIPVFPGANCEWETARAFESAGAVCDAFVLNNLSPQGIQASLTAMAKKISQAQILVIPGGFSGGDEPDGAGKFIATLFRNPLLKACVTDLIESRDGLILGICNGFQALIKLGLLPFGKITDLKPHDPTLTFNAIGRHVSQMGRTRVTSVLSPWLARCEPGECHTLPLSHGEGRFAADPQILQRLGDAGQIATQYVDLDGAPSPHMPWNPNGSVCAIEGLSSPDGRILGKMAHSERIGSHICANVPGNKDQRLFESGVGYFL